MALIVEDGTGLANADSYLSEADCDTYNTKYVISTAWSGGTTANKEKALRLATQFLDAMYQLRWKGSKINDVMSLDWPRNSVYDRDCFWIASDAVPQAVKNATAEMAIDIITNGEPMPNQENSGMISEKEVRVGPLMERIKYQGGNPPATYYRKTDKLVSELVEWGTDLIRG